MSEIFLQNILDDINSSNLPYNWNSFDFKYLSENKNLWNFQQNAVENALKILWKYYEDFKDYFSGEDLETNQERKRKLYKWYKDNGLNEDLDIKLDKRNRKINKLITEYFPQENGKVSYLNYINRMSFWMATGSGKTLVIIKLIQILQQLMERGEIPEYDILFLTHRDDLLKQFKSMIDEVNYANASRIELRELKDYPEVKRQKALYGEPIFYYRSDNISDVQKEKIIDFRNYDNGGRWFLFLDEAHKGEKEDSKRQHIYSILSRNGFLFNFSATFTDLRDVITSAFEFNLASFIKEGYGKHISILKQEIRAFGKDEDYNDEEKQKIVLKSLILLTYTKKFYERIKNNKKNIYHKPLLLTLVNSINTAKADLELFFRELERVGKCDVKPEIFEQSLTDLWDELKEEPEFLFEDNEKIKIDKEIFNGIDLKDILYYVFNSESFGEIEISFRPSNKKQVAFKLTTSDKHFALSKTGDMPDWLKNELDRFNINHQFEQEGFFEKINRDDSPINILMGSRAFYEGWDSNRPNIINFINIGTGTDAKKFILQSTGRGVRIEPEKNKRRRLLNLHNDNKIDDELFSKLKDIVIPIETLFVFGTNRKSLLTVIQELKKEKKEKRQQLSLFKNEDTIKDKLLLVPRYSKSDYPLMRDRELSKFPISEHDFSTLNKFINYIPDDRVLLFRYTQNLSDMPVEKLKAIRESVNRKNKFFKNSEKQYNNLDTLVNRIFDYFGVIPERLKEFKQLEDEIRHFKNIKVNLKDLTEIKSKINVMKDFPKKVKELDNLYGKISREEYSKENNNLKDSETLIYNYKIINIKYISNHYYVPVIMSKEEKIDYISHIIKIPSEVNFVNSLEDYVDENNNKFSHFDWWLFSKLDETLDDIYIPYYNPDSNRISKFNPDFVFWFKKDKNYAVCFIDPKGTKHTDFMHKVDGFKNIFEKTNSEKKNFEYKNLNCKVYLFLRTDDINKLPQNGYREYWFDNIEKVLDIILKY